MVKEYKLYWHNYKYFPYEKEFGIKEINEVLNPEKINITDEYVEIIGDFELQKLQKLAYFSEIVSGEKKLKTIQYKLEEKHREIKNSRNGQSTRYSVHGIHEYKGKFNPQVVRGILNFLGVEKGDRVLDPFCGSGTSIIESSIMNISSVGFDINPLAVLITNAKLKALSISYKEIKKSISELINRFYNERQNYTLSNDLTERDKYLLDWFPEKIFYDIETLRNIIDDFNYDIQIIMKVIVSDMIREYSLQEPSDLRIRRRKSPFPEVSFIKALSQSFEDFLIDLEASQNVLGLLPETSVSFNIDCSNESDVLDYTQNFIPFDFAITSPPYATALPYIDTQRLSLLWLNLINKKELKPLERGVIGSREMLKSSQYEWEEKMDNNANGIPEKLHQYCLKLNNALSPDDGFRRQAKPMLLYRYLSNMNNMFKTIYSVIKKDGYYALIVGHNSTTLGGKKFDINTPNLLVELGKANKWNIIKNMPLQTYQRYGIHQKNSISKENLIILKK